MKSKDLQPRLLHLVKLSFRIEGQIKCFTDKAKLKEFIITKPLIYEILKGITVYKTKNIKMLNIKMAINSQLSIIESKKQTKQTSRTGTESQIWRSFGGLSVGRGKEENRGKGSGIKKHKLLGTK